MLPNTTEKTISERHFLRRFGGIAQGSYAFLFWAWRQRVPSRNSADALFKAQTWKMRPVEGENKNDEFNGGTQNFLKSLS